MAQRRFHAFLGGVVVFAPVFYLRTAPHEPLRACVPAVALVLAVRNDSSQAIMRTAHEQTANGCATGDNNGTAFFPARATTQCLTSYTHENTFG